MALTDLSNETLLGFFQTWLEKPALFQKSDRVRVFLADIEVARDELLELVNAEKGDLSGLTAEATKLNTLHDDIIAGGADLLHALSRLARTPELKKKWSDLRHRLLPHGKRIIQAPFTDQAAAAVALEDRLDPLTRAELSTIPTNEGRTLEGEFDEAVVAAKRLGQIESERAGGAVRIRGATVEKNERLRRRSNALSLIGEIDDALARAHTDEETVAAILTPVREAAEAKKRKPKADDAETVPGTPTEPK